MYPEEIGNRSDLPAIVLFDQFSTKKKKERKKRGCGGVWGVGRDRQTHRKRQRDRDAQRKFVACSI